MCPCFSVGHGKTPSILSLCLFSLLSSGSEHVQKECVVAAMQQGGETNPVGALQHVIVGQHFCSVIGLISIGAVYTSCYIDRYAVSVHDEWTQGHSLTGAIENSIFNLWH